MDGIEIVGFVREDVGRKSICLCTSAAVAKDMMTSILFPACH